ncbi:unnamed protein product [Aureobasidium mustum]|uniref:Aminoglycoside phosphotransferase domain-containing protein n=1 Tax=Aureobasidium mustum TaxID=2773714 RepID=A0A9N8PGC1_9PEZI|nr:unnamed protein product [Aureobasidium mustum]
MTSHRTSEREYFYNESIFKKRSLRHDEFDFPETIQFLTERMTNENAALIYVKENTTIPVPEVIEFSQKDGSWTLITKIIPGVMLRDIEASKRQAAIEAVNQQMALEILPQLHRLTRQEIGSVDMNIPVYPPSVVLTEHPHKSWDRITCKDSKFVFCHNDLSGHNILVDPETYEIVGIVDWEYSGFFPPWFEEDLWKERFNQRDQTRRKAHVQRVYNFFQRQKDSISNDFVGEAKAQQEVLGDLKDDLKTCSN